MMEKLKVGVIGVGFIGEEHIEAIHRTFLGEVVAIAGHNIDSIKKKAESLLIKRYYTDYRQLLQQADIDVVHICTPNSYHYQMAKDTLMAGKHVVCEKPLTMTKYEAEELVKLAKEKNKVNAIHFNIRYYPLVRHAKEMISRGEIGEIYAVTGSYLQDWLLYDTDYSWRLESAQSGKTRAVGDIGTHWMDLTSYVTGLEISEVMADMETFIKTRKKPKISIETWSNKVLKSNDYEEVHIDTEDYASVLLHYKSGAKGCFTVNQMAAGRKNRVSFEINGSKNSIVWNSETPNEIIIGKRDSGNEIIIRDPSLVYNSAAKIITLPGGHNEGFADTSKQIFKEVYNYILEGDMSQEKIFPTFEDGLNEAYLCDAIVNSDKEGIWVKVDRSKSY